MIEILKAPPFATVQDAGWATGRAVGLPEGGAMDPLLLRAANALVGNPPGAAVIEWALGPGTLRAGGPARMAVLGLARVTVAGAEAGAGAALEVPAGAEVSIVPAPEGRFVYVAVRGGIDVPLVLGSRSTYLPGGFGGFAGRRLAAGDRLPVGEATGPASPAAGNVIGILPGASPGPVTLRLTRGPQWDFFGEAERERLLSAAFAVSRRSDRMGYRLEGPAIRPREAATLPSEPACPGAIQIPDGGQPIVLMPDGPTVGGYPKIAVVIRADLRLLAQCPPGREVRFREVTLDQARAALEHGPE